MTTTNTNDTNDNNHNNTKEKPKTLTLHLTLTAQSGAPRIPLDIVQHDAPLTSRQLRQLVSTATHIPLSHLKVIFRGRLVPDHDNDAVLSDFSMEHDSVLHCMGTPVTTSQANASNAANHHHQTSLTATTTTATATAAAANHNSATTTPSTTSTTPPASFSWIPPGVATAPISSTVSSSSSLSSPLEQALHQLQSAPSTTSAHYRTALQTLHKLVSNIVQHPHEEKYRRIKPSNAAFSKRVGQLPHSHEIMVAAGFELVSTTSNTSTSQPTPETESYYVLSAHPQAWPHLLQTQAVFQRALDQCNHNNNTNSNNNNSSTRPFSATGGLSPTEAEATSAAATMATNLMSNPLALQGLLNNPMIQQQMAQDPQFDGLRSMIQQVANDPHMAQQMAQMMQSPQLQHHLHQAMMQGTDPRQAAAAAAAAGAFAHLRGGNGSRGSTTPSRSTVPSTTSGSGSGASNNNTNNTTNNNNNTNSRSDNELTEEEMIAEAIRRSLQES
ncbi:hypothetical protein ACA910_013858 [Epithemia clementina (nom. ined.)]